MLAYLALFGAISVAFGTECGNPAIKPNLLEFQIIGGKTAVPGSWPWHVGLYQKPVLNFPPYDKPTHFCAGALINEDTVLTAAHCLGTAVRRVQIHLGSHLRAEKDEGEEYIDVKHFCSHYMYGRGNANEFDIGIIKLARKVEFTKTISPVCLPPAGDPVKEEDSLYVTGWGYTSSDWDRKPADELKQARQKQISKDECVKMRPIAADKLICTVHDHGSSCHGDSGGPLVVERDGIWQLQGVVSGGPPVCGMKNWPMYYSEVSAYRDWIDAYLQSADPVIDRNICK